MVGVHRTSMREEEARQLDRERTRDLEFKWAEFLTRGMQQGAIPEADAPLLHGRSSGSTTASSTGTGRVPASRSPRWLTFYVPRCLAVAGMPLESATKAAVVAYSEAMNKELGAHGVKSVALCPGFVDTDMSDFVKDRIPAEAMLRPATWPRRCVSCCASLLHA